MRAGGADVVDVRPVDEYAAAHIPGSLAITFARCLRDLVGLARADSATPLVIVRNPNQDPDEIIWQARKIGYDRLVGELTGGVAAWIAAAQPTSSTVVVDPASVDPTHLLDVRQRREYDSGHVPGAWSIELGQLNDLTAVALPRGPLVTMCGHGERAASGASLLERSGRTDVGVLVMGPAEWAATTGHSLKVGA